MSGGSASDAHALLDALREPSPPSSEPPADLPGGEHGVRVRIAPAPSGDLHVGNVRTAIYNWALARRHAGSFVLRVEDTDRSRVTDEAYRSAVDSLRWLGLDGDEGPERGGPHGPYRQSERLDVYAAAVERMVAAGAAYRSYETPQELEEMRARQRAAGRPPGYDGAHRDLSAEQRAAFEAEGRPSVVRLRMPDAGSEVVEDLVRGEVVFDLGLQSDPALTRADGHPLYLLASSVDDVLMRMTHVVRGEDLLPSVPRQRAVYAALGVPRDRWPSFAHLPLIVGGDGKPLSKRHADTAITSYRSAGYLPEAMVNYLTLLGFSLGEEEVFSASELVAGFDLARVSRNPARFDTKKLDAVAGEHVRRLAVEDLAARLLGPLQRAGLVGSPPSPEQSATVQALAPLLRTRLVRLSDAVDYARPLLVEESAFARDPADVAAVLVPEAAESLSRAADAVASVEPFDAAAVEAALRAELVDGLGLKPRVAFRPLYVALSGRRVGAPAFDTVVLLGRERAVARLRDAAALAEGAAGPGPADAGGPG